MPVITQVRNTRTIVVQRANTAVSVDAGIEALSTVDRRQINTVVNEPSVLNVAGIGRRGPTGLSGSGQIAPINFAFGDASPAPIYTPADDVLVDLVQVIIRVPFDGVGAQIALGTAASPELLMPYAYNAPGAVGTYEVSPDALLLAGEPILLTIVPGAGASAGSGQIVLNTNSL